MKAISALFECVLKTFRLIITFHVTWSSLAFLYIWMSLSTETYEVRQELSLIKGIVWCDTHSNLLKTFSTGRLLWREIVWLIRWFVERDLMVLCCQNSMPLSVLTTVKTDTWSETHRHTHSIAQWHDLLFRSLQMNLFFLFFFLFLVTVLSVVPVQPIFCSTVQKKKKERERKKMLSLHCREKIQQQKQKQFKEWQKSFCLYKPCNKFSF